ncbi:hypothetical protein, partial [Actinoplanes derwentensis]
QYRYIKHFWYGQQHGGYNWGGESGYSGGAISYDVSMVWNRDTSCTVYMTDGYDNWWSYARSSSGYGWVGYLYNDSNWAHTRCSTTRPFGT